MHFGLRKQTEKKNARRFAAGLGLLAVQSVSCTVVLLAVLVLRAVSGNLFGQLAGYFREAMQENSLTTALHALWEGDIPFEETDV